MTIARCSCPACVGFERYCVDFAIQRAAQRFFEANDPAVDPHRLDADGDGLACHA